MTRLNLVLLFAVLVSALYLVNVQYESRRLFTEIDRALQESRKLEAEKEHLQLEKREQATPRRVEKLAKEKLHMHAATPAITHYVNYSPAQTNTDAQAASTALRPVAGGRAP
jgi:cell division protein FtsL